MLLGCTGRVAVDAAGDVGEVDRAASFNLFQRKKEYDSQVCIATIHNTKTCRSAKHEQKMCD
jgi:hypothetical protein